jgi:hypothetical protein
MDLNKEAEDYANYVRKGVVFDDIEECLIYTLNAKEDFIAGANSKYVQAKIIQAQIEENESILRMLKLHGNARNRLPVIERISNLQVQLKELENER